MQKRWFKIAAIVTAVVLVALIAIPFLVDAETFRPTIQTRLSASLGRAVTFGHLSFSLLQGSLVAQDIAIADDPAFSSTPFLQAKALHIGVEVLPLVLRRQVRITQITIDAPSINLLHAANGRWNFSSMGRASTSQPSQSTQQAGAFPDLTVDELRIQDGSASVSSIPAVHKPLAYSELNLTVKQLSFLKPFSFELSAKLPASGSLNLTGNAGPLSATNAADTPFQAKLDLKSFDPVAAGVLDPTAGISMQVDLSSDLVSDGTSLISRGKIEADHLQLVRTGSPAPHPVNIDFEVSNQLDTNTGKVTNVSIHAGAVAARVTGSYQLTPQAMVLDLHLAAPNLPIDQVEELLPAFGVRLPTGSRLNGGTLNADLAVNGPAAATTISGPISVDNTKLVGFDLGSKIQGLNPFGHGAEGTEIQTLRATVNSSPQITQINSIYANMPQLGSATGSGTVAPSGALDFKLTATLASSNLVGATANQAMSAARSIVGGFLHSAAKPAPSNANRGIPVTITGTASSPSIHANVLAALK